MVNKHQVQKEINKEDQKNNAPSVFVLRLFVAGASPNSIRAISNVKNVCEAYLKDRYQLDIIDVHQQPSIAKTEQIIALPLLIKKSPGIERRMIGDMSDTDKVLRGLEIKSADN